MNENKYKKINMKKSKYLKIEKNEKNSKLCIIKKNKKKMKKNNFTFLIYSLST